MNENRLTCLHSNEDSLTFGAKVEREDLDGIPAQPVSRSKP
jgi:hypothetical protein